MAVEDVPPGQRTEGALIRPDALQVTEELGDTAVTGGSQVAGAIGEGGQTVQLVEGAHHDVRAQSDSLLDHDTAEARAWEEKSDYEAGREVAEMAARVDSFEPAPAAGQATNIQAFRAHMADNPLYNKLGVDLGGRGEVAQVPGTGIRNRIGLETSVVGWEGAGKARVVQGMNEAAASYERRAQRKGDWAQAIHEHPPTVEFLKAHGWDIQEVTPENLMRVEYVRDRLLAEANAWSDRLNALDSSYAELRAQGDSVDMVSMLALRMRADSEAVGDSEALNIFRDLAARDETTIGDLKQVYQTMCQVEADAIRHAVGNSDVVIAAIKSGEYPGPTEPSEQAA